MDISFSVLDDDRPIKNALIGGLLMKDNDFERITTELNRKRRIAKGRMVIKLMTMQEIFNMLDYLESLEESVEYVEEAIVEKLNFD